MNVKAITLTMITENFQNLLINTAEMRIKKILTTIWMVKIVNKKNSEMNASVFGA